METNLQKIVTALKKKGLSQSEIARQAGVDKSTICHLMAGRWGVKQPSYKLANGLITVARSHGINENGNRLRVKK